MTKTTITKTWIGGLAIFAAGIVVAIIGVFLMLAYGGTFTQVVGSTNQYDFVPNMNGFFWVAIGLIVTGGLFALAGGIVQFVAWIGGLFNSFALPSKAWFGLLIVGGLVSFFFALAPVGFAVMLAYIIAAPDGTPYQLAVQPPAPAARPLQPTA